MNVNVTSLGLGEPVFNNEGGGVELKKFKNYKGHPRRLAFQRTLLSVNYSYYF